MSSPWRGVHLVVVDRMISRGLTHPSLGLLAADARRQGGKAQIPGKLTADQWRLSAQ